MRRSHPREPDHPGCPTQPNHPGRTAAEIRRFKAWLAERLASTAPVTTWPPDQLDFFGGRPVPPPQMRDRPSRPKE